MNPRLVLPGAMLVGTFAWSYVGVTLPFFVRDLSPLDPVATLRWTGWILGITALVTVATAPLWGWVGERGDPRVLYAVTQGLQGVTFFGMAASRTVAELFFVRFLLGVWGAASTFAFIMAGRHPDRREVRLQISYMQGALTVGQVVGPLAGTLAAARLGFRGSFVLGGVILLACAAFVYASAPVAPAARAETAHGGGAPWSEVLAVSTVVFGASMQVWFLPSILPEILPVLGTPPARTLEVGGMLIFVSGVAAALGSVAAPRLAASITDARLIQALLMLSSIFLVAFGLASSVWGLGVLRFLQVLCVAPVFPLIFARIAHRAGGQAIGFINSARIGAAFVGPVAATSLLAWSPAPLVYACLGASGLACLPFARAGRSAPARA